MDKENRGQDQGNMEGSQLTFRATEKYDEERDAKKYNKSSIPDTLKNAKQRLRALASRLKRYTIEIEATEYCIVSGPTENATQNNNAHWLKNLSALHPEGTCPI